MEDELYLVEYKFSLPTCSSLSVDLVVADLICPRTDGSRDKMSESCQAILSIDDIFSLCSLFCTLVSSFSLSLQPLHLIQFDFCTYLLILPVWGVQTGKAKLKSFLLFNFSSQTMGNNISTYVTSIRNLFTPTTT